MAGSRHPLVALRNNRNTTLGNFRCWNQSSKQYLKAHQETPRSVDLLMKPQNVIGTNLFPYKEKFLTC